MPLRRSWSPDLPQPNNFIHDQLIQELSAWLSDLKVFKLFGCSHVGPRGYFAVLRAAGANLEELGLEGVGVVSWLEGFDRPRTHPSLSSAFQGDDEDQLDEDLYLERESPLSQGIRLSKLKQLFLSETAFTRLLIPDYSRQEQMYVERALSQHGEYGLDLATIERNGSLPQLSNSSFLPPTLESFLLSRERDSLAYRAGAPAIPLFEAVSQLWPDTLKKLWMSHFIVDFGDLRKIGELLPGLESLMIRLPPTKCPVSLTWNVLKNNHALIWNYMRLSLNGLQDSSADSPNFDGFMFKSLLKRNRQHWKRRCSVWTIWS